LLLVLPFVSTYTWLQLEKVQVRKSIKRQMIVGLDDSRLVKLVFTHEEAKAMLHWEHSKEFEYNGQLYDVVRQQSESSLITFWCFPDHAETRLQKQLSAMLRMILQRDTQRQEKQAQVHHFYKNLFYTQSEDTHLFSLETHFDYLLSDHHHADSPLILSPSPPPRLA
jgi:hypothetical protein